MSRFTQEERKKYENALLVEGERIFNKKGLDEVVVEDIVKAVGIGKGTFYHFFTNKEHLYMEIYNKIQEEMFERVEKQLDKKQSASKDKMLSILFMVFEEFLKCPMLRKLDEKMYAKLTKKAPPESFLKNDAMDRRMIKKVEECGIRFKYPVEQVTRLIQILFLNAYFVNGKEDLAVVKLLFESVCQYIVEED